MRVYLKYLRWMITDRLSIRKMPHSTGSSSSLRMSTALTPITPPIVRLPVSPMNTWAGKVLYHRNPSSAPTKAAI